MSEVKSIQESEISKAAYFDVSLFVHSIVDKAEYKLLSQKDGNLHSKFASF